MSLKTHLQRNLAGLPQKAKHPTCAGFVLCSFVPNTVLPTLQPRSESSLEVTCPRCRKPFETLPTRGNNTLKLNANQQCSNTLALQATTPKPQTQKAVEPFKAQF